MSLVKTTVIGNGQFNCPHCGVERAYHHQRLQKYRALLFIPLSPEGDPWELIECQVCGKTYNLDVLEFKPSKPQKGAARLIGAVKAKLEKGYSEEYIIQDLIDQGVDPETAKNTVEIAKTS
jgi:hypothetical protein